MIHRLAPCHPEFQENVVIGAADKDPRLFHADLFHQPEVFLARTDPRSHLRKLIAALHTLVDRIPVLLAVQEEFALADHAVWTAEPVQVVVYRHDLLCAVRCPRLLPVPESRVGDPDLPRHAVRDNPVVKRDLRDLIVGKHIAECVGFLHVLQLIHMFLDPQKIVVLIHGNWPVFKIRSVVCHIFFLRSPPLSGTGHSTALDRYRFCICVLLYTKIQSLSI